MIFDKSKCAKCKYHGYLGSVSNKQNAEAVEKVIFCDFAHLQKQTCLYSEHGKVLDRRGTNPEKCALYVKGNRQHYYGFGAKSKNNGKGE